MADFDTSRLNDLFAGFSARVAGTDPAVVAASQASNAVSETQSVLGVSEDDARKFVGGMVYVTAKNNGLVPNEVWNNLPPNVQAIIKYGPTELKANQQLTNIKTFGTPVAIVTAVVAALALGVAPVVAIPAALGAFAWYINGLANDWNDVNHWGPQFQQQTALELYKMSQKYEAIGLSSGNTFTDVDAEEIWSAYDAAGATTINDPIAMQSLSLTKANVRKSLNNVAAIILSDGRTFTKKDALALFHGWIVFGNKHLAAVAAAELKKTAAPAPITATITIQGLPSSSFVVPANIIKKITNVDELQMAVSAALQQFLGGLVNRLSFTMAQRSYVVTPQGQMIRPMPPFFTKPDATDPTKPPRVVANKIVVLAVYYIDDQGKRIKLDEFPLDYSIADDVITPEPTQAELEQAINLQLTTGPTTSPVAVVPAAAAPAATETAAQPQPAPIPAASAAAPQAAPAASASPVTAAYGGLPATITFAPLGTLTLDSAPAFGIGYHDKGVGNFSSFWGVADAVRQFPDQFPKRTVHVNVDALMVRASASSSAALAGSQKLLRGNPFDVVGWMAGETVDGESRWWVSSLGHFVWMGGTTEKG